MGQEENKEKEISEQENEDKNNSNSAIVTLEENKNDENSEEQENKNINIKEDENSDKEEKEEVTEKKEKKKKEEKIEKEEKVGNKKKRIILTSFILITLLIVALLVSTLFALVNMNNQNIMDGIKINNIDVSGLTKEEAKTKLENSIQEQLKNNIMIKYKEEYETSLLPEKIEIKYDIDDSIDKAYNIGRSGNIVKNNYEILYSMLFKNNIDSELAYNETTMNEFIQDIAKKIPGAVQESSYYIEDGKLIITKGTAGIDVDEEKLEQMIINEIKQQTKNYIEIPTNFKEPDPIDIDKIYEEVHQEPKDAYYETDPFKIYPEVEGVDFKITLEEARKMLEEEKDEYVIELVYTTPSYTVDQIGTEAFPDLLATSSTKYDVTNTNRTTNLELSAAKINGTVLMPGEEFSYNKVVGKRTIEAGYKNAAIYEGGKVVDGLGGGICQISSTLYYTVVLANLEITDRTNHQFLTSYTGPGKDATVVYGAIDFKFKNSRNYPIKIEATVNSGIAKISIYGVKEENEYKVEVESTILNYIPYTTKYEENPNLNLGEERVIQGGSRGCTSITYKILYLNGVEVSRTVLSKDTYSAMNRIVSRGTKGEAVVETTPSKVEEKEEKVEKPKTDDKESEKKPEKDNTEKVTKT